MFERGFKTKAEKLSSEFRTKTGIHVCGVLPAQHLANHLNVGILTLDDLDLDDKIKSRLLGQNGNDSGWSAVILNNCDNKKVIVHNHLHSEARQQSNLMHELAHVICGHTVDDSHVKHLSFLRKYDAQQEEEAGFLGAALQLSRPALLWAVKEKMSDSEIALYFNASVEMVRFRINSTGVRKQIGFKNR